MDTTFAQCRQNACVVAAGNHQYVFGGSNPDTMEFVTKAERVDTVENKWEEIADMPEERSQAFGVVCKRKIFVARGTDWTWSVETSEMYTASTNEWQYVASFSASRSYGNMVCLKGKLYVLGGSNERNQTVLSVECFDTAND